MREVGRLKPIILASVDRWAVPSLRQVSSGCRLRSSSLPPWSLPSYSQRAPPPARPMKHAAPTMPLRRPGTPQASEVRPALRHYYMGYYIHSCPKMSYKGSYSPSYLLCPERLSWVPLDLCRPVLDRQRYARLSDLLIPPPTPTAQASGAGSDGRKGGKEANREGGGQGEGGGASEAESSAAAAGRRRPSSSLSPSPSPPQPPPPPSKRNVQSPRPGGGSRRQGVSRGGTGSAPRSAADAAMAAAAADEALGVNEVPIMVTFPPFAVRFSALTAPSKAMIRDALRMYVATIGPDMARKIVLKVHD